jgi:ribonuclease HI
MKKVVIHTDGACKGNPGPGAYAAVLTSGSHRREISAGYRLTTNNRMELRAAIAALELLSEPCEVELHSDSKYLVHALKDRWLEGWQRRGWLTAGKQPVKNQDLWRRLADAMAPHRIHWHWVKGHAGHAGNERCDTLANHALTQGELLEDTGFCQTED